MECRDQYAEANRSERVPCDIDGLEACPYYNRSCGSPGDTGPDGCGLAAENVDVIDFYPKWKVLGEAAFQLVDLEFKSTQDADDFASKLMMVESYSERIHNKQRTIEEAKSKQREAHSTRRGAPPKLGNN